MTEQRVVIAKIWIQRFVKLCWAYFFEYECEIAVNVKVIPYWNRIMKILWSQLEDMVLNDMWFQQDDAIDFFFLFL